MRHGALPRLTGWRLGTGPAHPYAGSGCPGQLVAGRGCAWHRILESVRVVQGSFLEVIALITGRRRGRRHPGARRRVWMDLAGRPPPGRWGRMPPHWCVAERRVRRAAGLRVVRAEWRLTPRCGLREVVSDRGLPTPRPGPAHTWCTPGRKGQAHTGRLREPTQHTPPAWLPSKAAGLVNHRFCNIMRLL